MNKEAHYKKIIQAQRQFLFAFFGMPLLVMVAVSLIGERYLFALAIPWFLLFAWSGFRLKAVDTCPWCGFSFIEKSNFWRLGMGSLSIPPRKCCINCGAPCHKPVAKP